MNIEQINHVSKLVAPIAGTTISIATVGSIISILAGIFTIIYTILRIYDWCDKRYKNKTKKNKAKK